jgi:hypothetical protein
MGYTGKRDRMANSYSISQRRLKLKKENIFPPLGLSYTK